MCFWGVRHTLAKTTKEGLIALFLFIGVYMRGRKPKYAKASLRVLAELNGMSISALEYRRRVLKMPLSKALNTPIKVLPEITLEILKQHNHLSFREICEVLGIEPRKLERLSKKYDIYFRKQSHTHNETIVVLWCALHSPVLRLKHMAKFVSDELGFSVNENYLKYRFTLFGFTLKDIKKDLTYYQHLMLNALWGDYEPNQS